MILALETVAGDLGVTDQLTTLIWTQRTSSWISLVKHHLAQLTNVHHSTTHALLPPVVGVDEVQDVGLVSLIARVHLSLDWSSSLPLPSVHVLVFEHVFLRAVWDWCLLLLVLEHVLDAWPGPGVHHVVPVLVGVSRQLLPPLHDQHARVADLTIPGVLQLEASNTVHLILLAISEPGAETILKIKNWDETVLLLFVLTCLTLLYRCSTPPETCITWVWMNSSWLLLTSSVSVFWHLKQKWWVVWVMRVYQWWHYSQRLFHCTGWCTRVWWVMRVTRTVPGTGALQ